jgi:hypothetical protein
MCGARKLKGYREALLTIEDVLLKIWDPIGVKAEPDAQDEYRRYAPPILRELMRNSDYNIIADILEKIRTEQMGLPSNRKVSIQAAKALRIAFAGMKSELSSQSGQNQHLK